MESFLSSVARNLTSKPATATVVFLSHVPLVELASPDISRMVLGTIQPSYLFSGHTHRPKVRCHGYTIDGVCASQEFTLPTCSYRMGEAFMGLGTATVGMQRAIAC